MNKSELIDAVAESTSLSKADAGRAQEEVSTGQVGWGPVAGQLVRRGGGREEKAADERAELEILERYLPEQLSEDELKALVIGALAEGGFTTMADMGQAMKAVNIVVAGRAEGRVVADLVKSQLS